MHFFMLVNIYIYIVPQYTHIKQCSILEERIGKYKLKAVDADPSPPGPCVVDVTNKFTWTTEVLRRKRDGMAAL